MPIYEYWCNRCKKKTTLLVMSLRNQEAPSCRFCGSKGLTKLVSRFATPRSEESRLESLADPNRLGGLDESDPKSIARWMKNMGRELGEDLGDDFDQMVDETASEGELTGEGKEDVLE